MYIHTHTHTHTRIRTCRCPPAEYHRLLDSIIKKQGVFHPTDKGTGVFISLRPLWGTIGKVKEENPLLFRKFTAECQKLGFPEIIRPCELRHAPFSPLISLLSHHFPPSSCTSLPTPSHLPIHHSPTHLQYMYMYMYLSLYHTNPSHTLSTDDVRHDVYLTLVNGLFNKGTKRADKNVEVDVEVLDIKENPIPV